MAHFRRMYSMIRVFLFAANMSLKQIEHNIMLNVEAIALYCLTWQ